MKHQFKDQKPTTTLVETTEEPVMEVVGDETHKKQPEIKTVETVSEFKKAKIVGASLVNMREEPNGHVIAVLNEGTTVEAKNNGEWSEVRYNGKTGHVMSKYIK